MTAFWLAAALMTAVTVLAIGLPLFRKSSGRKDQRADYDITVYKDQLAEIDRDVESGLLGEAEAEAAKIEIQRRMLKATAATVRMVIRAADSQKAVMFRHLSKVHPGGASRRRLKVRAAGPGW